MQLCWFDTQVFDPTIPCWNFFNATLLVRYASFSIQLSFVGIFLMQLCWFDTQVFDPTIPCWNL